MGAWYTSRASCSSILPLLLFVLGTQRFSTEWVKAMFKLHSLFSHVQLPVNTSTVTLYIYCETVHIILKLVSNW